MVVLLATLLGLLLGIIISEYDDAPGAVVILPLLACTLSIAVYSALLFLKKRRHYRDRFAAKE